MLARISVAMRKPTNSTRPMTSVSTVPTPAVMSWRRRSVPLSSIGALLFLLLRQLETHQGLGGYLDRGAVDEHGRVSPALHGADRGAVEDAGGRRLQHLHVARLSPAVDGERQQHAPGHAVRQRALRVIGR